MDASVNVTKVYLENTPLSKYCVMGAEQQTYEAALLRWHKFSKQKLRFEVIKNNGCRFSVTERLRYLEVIGTTAKHYKMIDCFIVYSGTKTSEPFVAERLSAKKYKFEIPLTFFTRSADVRTNKDSRLLMIRFLIDVYLPLELHTLYKNGSVYRDSADVSGFLARLNCPINYEEDKISDTLDFAMQQNCFTDFVIRVQDRKIRVHKSILASRSAYFRDHIRNNCKGGANGEIRMDATYEAVIAVVRYLYTGRMEVRSWGELLSAFELARQLKMTSFLKLFSTYFLKTLYEQKGNQLRNDNFDGKFVLDWVQKGTVNALAEIKKTENFKESKRMKER